MIDDETTRRAFSVGIGILLLLGIGYFAVSSGYFSLTGAFSVLSLGQVDYSTSGTHFNHEWRALVLLGRGSASEVVAGTHDISTDLDGRPAGFINNSITLKDGTTVSKKFGIKYELTSEACRYNYEPTSYLIDEWQFSNAPSFDVPRWAQASVNIPSGQCVPSTRFLTPTDLYGYKTEFQTACHNVNGVVASCSYQAAGVTIWGSKCVIATVKPNSGKTIRLSQSSVLREYTAKMTITNENGTVETVLMPEGGAKCATDVCFEEKILGLGASDCPSPEVAVVFIGSQYLHGKVIPKSIANNVINTDAHDYILGAGSFSEWNTLDTVLQGHVNYWNSQVATLNNAATPTNFISSADRSVDSNLWGSLWIGWNQAVFYPVYMTYINADWVGIVEPVADPTITLDSSSITIHEGETQNFGFTVRNDGQAGVISTGFTCASGISASGLTPSTDLNLAKDASQHYSVVLTGNAHGTGSCTATSAGARGQNRDTKTLSATIQAAIVRPTWCIPPTWSWDGTTCAFVGCPTGYHLNPNTHVCDQELIGGGGAGGCGFALPPNAAWIDQSKCSWECNANYTYNGTAAKCESKVAPEINWGIVAIILAVIIAIGGAAYVLNQRNR